MLTTHYKTATKKFLMALAVVAIGLAGANAMALDSAGAAKSGKAYHTYPDSAVHDMLDAINRDYPVQFSATRGGNYGAYSDDDSTAFVDAINKGSGPVAVNTTVANPYVRIDGDRAHELIAMLNRDQGVAVATAPSARVEYVQVSAPVVTEAVADDSLAQSLADEINS